MNKEDKIYVAGHSGLAGSAIVRRLIRRGYKNILTIPHTRTDGLGLDLRRPTVVENLINTQRPSYIFMCAAHSGGIKEAIDNPAEMLTDNIRMTTNILEYASKHEMVKKVMNLGSSCIYPVDALQPYGERSIGTGKTDENWSYAVAKIAGIELCRAYKKQYNKNFISVIPANLYGPGDNFDLDKAHVIPAILRKFHESNGTPVRIWGDGTAKREFLYVDDFADACVWIMENLDYDDLVDGVINVGTGRDISIFELANLVQAIVPDEKHYVFDKSEPHGISSKLMDVTALAAAGWSYKTSLLTGLAKTYEWYKENRE